MSISSVSYVYLGDAHRLFNVTSSFDENLYTTPLDKGSLSMEQRAHAERMAAEIEGKSSSNIHMREERNMVRAVWCAALVGWLAGC